MKIDAPLLPKVRLSPLWLAMVAATGASGVTAQETVYRLDPLQISAASETRSDQVVDAQQLERFQADDLVDVFQSLPDVSVGGSLGIAQKVYVRGIEDTLLNVSIDGASQAGTLFHHSGRLAIEPELLKRIEVDTGAGRATAGAGALGGAIRFETKDPEDLLRPGEQAGGLVKLGGFSNTEGYKANLTVFGRLNEQWSALAFVSQADHKRFRDGDGERVAGTDAEQQLGYLKLVGQLPAGQVVRLSHEVRTDKGERPQRPQWIVSGFNRLYELDGRRDTTTFNYGIDPAGNPWLDASLTLYNTEARIEQNVADRWGRYFGFTHSAGGDLRNRSQLGAHVLTYGVDYRSDKVNAGDAANRKGEEETGEVAGVYLQADYWLTQRLLLSTGARYDDYRLTDNNDQRFSEDAVSPNVNIAWEALDGLTLKAGYARAFRGPTTRDTFKIDRAQNAPDLKGERAVNRELGFDWVYQDFTLAAEIYRSTIKDVVADRLGGPVLYENIGDLTSDGFRVSTSYQWDRVYLGLGYHSNDAELNGNPLTVYEYNLLGNTVGDSWVADLIYHWNRNLEFGWQGRFVKGIRKLETSVGTIDKPGYGVHDLFLHWLPTGSDDLRLTVTVKNVADKQYLDHASNGDFQHIPGYEGVVGMPEPGRDIRLGLALRF
ncbi:MAG: TonB-dependent receptor [Marinobacter sp.]|nr:TonB-dependent receptor [Marinobacter sp.]